MGVVHFPVACYFQVPSRFYNNVGGKIAPRYTTEGTHPQKYIKPENAVIDSLFQVIFYSERLYDRLP